MSVVGGVLRYDGETLADLPGSTPSPNSSNPICFFMQTVEGGEAVFTFSYNTGYAQDNGDMR